MIIKDSITIERIINNLSALLVGGYNAKTSFINEYLKNGNNSFDVDAFLIPHRKILDEWYESVIECLKGFLCRLLRTSMTKKHTI